MLDGGAPWVLLGAMASWRAAAGRKGFAGAAVGVLRPPKKGSSTINSGAAGHTRNHAGADGSGLDDADLLEVSQDDSLPEKTWPKRAYVYDVLDGLYMMGVVLTLVFVGLALTLTLMTMSNDDEDGGPECGGWGYKSGSTLMSSSSSWLLKLSLIHISEPTRPY